MPHSLLKRAPTNPILAPIAAHKWESFGVFNAACIYLDNKVHFVYRAVGDFGLSVFGYAASHDGVTITERLPTPIFASSLLPGRKCDVPFLRSNYNSGGSHSGCEDPRLVTIDDTIYMTYTVYDGAHPPAVAITSISVDDFLVHTWDWRPSVLISPLSQINKNWVLFDEKIKGKYALLHSITPAIMIDYFDDLNFQNHAPIKSHHARGGRADSWDNWLRGAGPPPIKVPQGWLLLYHAMDNNDPDKYKIGAMILDKDDPTKIIARSNRPLLEPQAPYETKGFKPGVIYCCGALTLGDELFVYYGSADTFVCAAHCNLNALLAEIENGSLH